MVELFTDLFKGNGYLYFCQLDHSFVSSEVLAQKMAEWGKGAKILVGFDRSLWASLSAGLMPSELFQFHLYNVENKILLPNYCFFIFSSNPLNNFPPFVEVLSHLKINEIPRVAGEITEPVEIDESFSNCYYGTLLVFNETSSKITFPPFGFKVQYSEKVILIIDKSLAMMDAWVEEYSQELAHEKLLSAAYLFFPESYFMQNLPEMVRDKEKIHLEQEIKGIHC